MKQGSSSATTTDRPTVLKQPLLYRYRGGALSPSLPPMFTTYYYYYYYYYILVIGLSEKKKEEEEGKGEEEEKKEKACLVLCRFLLP